MTGNQLREALAVVEWKQQDFCHATGVHRNSVSAWCRDEAEVPKWVESYVGLLLQVKALAASVLEPKQGNTAN